MAARHSILAAFGIALGAVAPAQAPTAQEQIALAVYRGTMLYAYDQAAWHATDDFKARGGASLSKACGWVATGPVDATSIAFVDCANKSALYRARFSRGKFVSGAVVEGGESAALTELEQQMILARDRGLDALLKAEVGICSTAKPNIAVLPPEGPGQPALVYLLTPQTDLDKLPLGGHHRISVNADGSTSSLRPFTKTCMDLPATAPKDANPLLFWTGHLLDPVPTEIHVFSSLSAKLPILVGTRDRKIWRVDGSRITEEMQVRAKE